MWPPGQRSAVKAGSMAGRRIRSINDRAGTAEPHGQAPGADRGRGDGGRAARTGPWADLLRRAFAVDVLACPRGGGRRRVGATIADPALVQRVLDHFGLASPPMRADPAQPLPASRAVAGHERFAD